MIHLPDKFVDMLSAMPGHGDVAHALSETDSPTAIRLNPAKPLLDDIPGDIRRVPWEPEGLYLNERPQFTFHTGLYDGRFYVQDPSSMIIGEAVRRLVSLFDGPINYLDACAAPGGKTTSVMSVFPEGSFILANEYETERVRALVDNLQRWGLPDYAVSRADARQMSAVGEIFDIVGADVPCSGEGMMRKNPTAVTQWSPRLVEECARLQRQIITSLWQTLRPGGYLIYSTCTFNTSENEQNVEWIIDQLDAEAVDLGLAEFPGVMPGIRTRIPCARMLPGCVDGEGQFVAVIRKKDRRDQASLKTPSRERDVRSSECMNWVYGDFQSLIAGNGDVFAIRPQHYRMISHLMAKTHVIVPGLHIATPKGRDFMPAQALATSLMLRDSAFPIADVDYPTALAFLRGEALKLDSSIPKGFVLIEHDANRLGWAKNIGSRANNLFPDGLRIRSTHLPDRQPALW